MDRTNAERQRRYIQRLKERATAGVSNATDAAKDREIARLKARIRDLEAENARLRAEPGSGKAAGTRAANRAAEPPQRPHAAKADPEPKRGRTAAKIDPATMSPQEMVEAAIRHYCPGADRIIKHGGGSEIYRSRRRKIRADLHPDNVQHPALKERCEEASKLFNTFAGPDRLADREPKRRKGQVPWEDRRRPNDLPRTVEELLAGAAKAKAARAAKRKASKQARQAAQQAKQPRALPHRP
jgi:hypothetical protein